MVVFYSNLMFFIFIKKYIYKKINVIQQAFLKYYFHKFFSRLGNIIKYITPSVKQASYINTLCEPKFKSSRGKGM
jgi:hypothetical protein